MVYNFPAPEEARTYKDYVALFKRSNPEADYKEACEAWASVSKGFASIKGYFDWCWQQPEAEAIYQAFTQ